MKLRTRRLKSNCGARKAERIIERMLGLPAGSVALVVPGRRTKRARCNVGRLREVWLVGRASRGFSKTAEGKRRLLHLIEQPA